MEALSEFLRSFVRVSEVIVEGGQERSAKG